MQIGRLSQGPPHELRVRVYDSCVESILQPRLKEEGDRGRRGAKWSEEEEDKDEEDVDGGHAYLLHQECKHNHLKD